MVDDQLNCVHAIASPFARLASASTKEQEVCNEPFECFIDVPALNDEKQIEWAPAPYCLIHAAEQAILKYLYGASPTPFTEEEIGFLAKYGYNRGGVVFKA